jgi:signal peptidase I
VALKTWEELNLELMKEAKRYKPVVPPEPEELLEAETIAIEETIAIVDEITIVDEAAEEERFRGVIEFTQDDELPDTEGLPAQEEAVWEAELPEKPEIVEAPDIAIVPEVAEAPEVAIVLEPAAKKGRAKQREKKPVKEYRLLSIFVDILFYTAILVVLFSAITSKPTDGTPKTVMGYSYFTVLTTSMQSEIPKGSFILVRETNAYDLKVGDNITFMRSDRIPVTHKIIDVYDNFDGSDERWFHTKGVDNMYPDEELVPEKNVLGKVNLVLPGLGAFISYMNSNIVLVCIVYGLCVLLSFSFRVLFKKPGNKKLTASAESGEAAAS